MARTKEGEREHLSAYIEQLTASASVSRVWLFFGHINADMDSVGGTVGATELYDAGVPVLNGEIMYACAYARSGDKTILEVNRYRGMVITLSGSIIRWFWCICLACRHFSNVF